MKTLNTYKQKGAVLYFAIIIMSILLAAVLGISTVTLIQIRTIKGAGDGIVAFYAADTGAEMALNDLYENNVSIGGEYSGILDNGASYEVKVIQPIGGTIPNIDESIECNADYYCIKSTGIFHNTKRAVGVEG